MSEDNLDKYLLKVPEEQFTAVINELNNRDASFIEPRQDQNDEGVLYKKIVFICPKIIGFQEWLSEITNGKGSIAMTGELE